MNNKILLWFWGCFAAGILSIALLFFMLNKGWLGEMPSFEELENPETAHSTLIISTDNVVIGKFFRQNRSDISFTNINPNLQHALMATEDIRFYDHTGVDLRALLRVVAGALTGDSKGGGSTITQQLAKNLFPREKNQSKIELIFRKLKEWIIAVRLERSYTKDEIMAMYLNTVEFSDNAFGVKSAANTYFGKPVDSLNVQESAVLVGMLKAPYQFNPRIHPVASLQRRNVVLNQMYTYKYLTKGERDSLFNIPIALDFHPDTHVEGLAPYFREYIRIWLKDWCAKNLKPDGSKWNIYEDGLKIYTTIDSRLQRYAEEAQRETLSEIQPGFFEHWKGKDPWKDFPIEWQATYHSCARYKEMKAAGMTAEQMDKVMNTPVKMKVFSYEGGEKDTVMSPYDSIRYHRMILQNGFMAMDPSSGFVRAWVGGVNYKYFQFDHVNVNTKRQIGSTFKPFVYTVAIRDKGYSPCFRVPNQLVTFEKDDPRFGLISDWTPHNSDGKYGGTLSLKQALANSINSVTAYLMHEMTPGAVVQLAQSMGITSEIPAQPSICLGTADISLFEMLGAYSTFANNGIHTVPMFISRIEDKNGNVIQDFVAQKNEVLDEQTNYIMVELLRGVTMGGTATRLRYRYKIPGDLLGKTGTTQNYSDGWFIGCTPDLIAGSWVGCDDRYLHFRSMQLGQGASTALPIWGKFFQKIYADSTNFKNDISPTSRFYQPAKLNIEFDCSKADKGSAGREQGSQYE